jgi:uncharacterized protein
VKLQPDRLDNSLNVIAGYTGEGITVNGELRSASVVVPWSGDVAAWPASQVEELSEEHFQAVADLSPEVVLLGTGPRIRFAHPSVLRPLIDRGIGVETMDTPAACRTYNILVSEGRSVVAVLLLDSVK